MEPDLFFMDAGGAAAPPPETSWPAQSLQGLSLSLYPPLRLFRVKSCKYLLPAQEILMEFCGLNNNNIGKAAGDSGSSWGRRDLFAVEPSELQKRKTRLLSMMEEVDRKYKRYCEQMKAMVSTFEDIAGEGAASAYSQLASKAMSRHFRCLRDGINGEMKATRRAMGESEAAATTAGTGLTRGETPRLKALDQCLRQQKVFQQAGVMESHPWRPQRGLPDRSVSILRAWLFEHFLHP